MKVRTPAGPRRGVAAVELAVVLTFIILPLLLGLWEVGRMIEVQQILTNAVREGARSAASGAPNTNTSVQNVVKNYLSTAGLPTADVNVVVADLDGKDVSQAGYLDKVKVTASIPFSDVRWSVTSMFVSPSTKISATAVWISMVDKNFQGFTEPPAG